MNSIQPICPLCGSDQFKSYRGRKMARCVQCGSKERGRLMGLALKHLDIRITGYPVYHFAPEQQIADILIERFRSDYRAADFVPERYSWSKVPVEKIDLSRALETFSPSSIGGFVHSHVLEHIPGSIERIVSDMNTALAPGGFHAFQVPIESGWYREDMDPDLDPAERLRVYRQEDHLRMFGAKDFDERILRLFSDFTQVDLGRHFDEEGMKRAAIPPHALTTHTGHSVFLFVKNQPRVAKRPPKLNDAPAH